MGGQMHGGRGRRKRTKSRYGQQLTEKQTLKDLYGVSEAQLRIYYATARRRREETGPYLIGLLERRLDNAIFRSGLAGTRPMARQMASHRFFQVNGKAVDVPSYRLRAGDAVQIRPSKRDKAYFSNFEKRMQNVQAPAWIQINADDFGFSVVRLPETDDALTGVDIQSVVEFLAR